jgi:hypothetical protein
MKLYQKILIIIAVIIAIPLIVALFLPSDYAIEREITISKPKQFVFDYVKYLKNQDYYSVWNMADPKMKKNYTGTDGTVGFIAAWDSKNSDVGKGEQEILKITDGESIETKLRFKIPFEAEDNAYMTTQSVDENTTKVKWGFSGSYTYPFSLMGLIFGMEKKVGGDLASGLANLKVLLEKQ